MNECPRRSTLLGQVGIERVSIPCPDIEMRPTAKYAFSAVRRLTQHCKQLLRVDRETILDHRASGINHDKPWGAAGTVIHHGRGIATVRRDCVVKIGRASCRERVCQYV